MKKISFWLVICLGIASTLPSCNKKASEKEWQLVWEDNFDQGVTFDEASWSKIPRGTSDWDNYMSDFDSLYAIRDGNLILRGINNFSLPTDTAPFLTGGVYTKGKVGFSDGRVSIRAKLRGATGAWPAFWLLPEGEGWPKGGEIDIMERLNHDTIAYQTTHSYYTHVLGIKDNPKQGGIGAINPNDYNIYSVEMYPDSLVYYINDNHTYTYPRIQTDQEGQFPFDSGKKFYLLLDMQLGGSWVGGVDPKDLPVEMDIDWVRFYQQKKEE